MSSYSYKILSYYLTWILPTALKHIAFQTVPSNEINRSMFFFHMPLYIFINNPFLTSFHSGLIFSFLPSSLPLPFLPLPSPASLSLFFSLYLSIFISFSYFLLFPGHIVLNIALDGIKCYGAYEEENKFTCHFFSYSFMDSVTRIGWYLKAANSTFWVTCCLILCGFRAWALFYVHSYFPDFVQSVISGLP